MSDERRKRVRLMDVDKNNESMTLIKQYTNYIGNTLTKLLRNSDDVYEEDLIKCREYSNRIKRYSECILGGEDLRARVAIKNKEGFIEEVSNETDEI